MGTCNNPQGERKKGRGAGASEKKGEPFFCPGKGRKKREKKKGIENLRSPTGKKKGKKIITLLAPRGKGRKKKLGLVCSPGQEKGKKRHPIICFGRKKQVVEMRPLLKRERGKKKESPLSFSSKGTRKKGERHSRERKEKEKRRPFALLNRGAGKGGEGGEAASLRTCTKEKASPRGKEKKGGTGFWVCHFQEEISERRERKFSTNQKRRVRKAAIPLRKGPGNAPFSKKVGRWRGFQAGALSEWPRRGGGGGGKSKPSICGVGGGKWGGGKVSFLFPWPGAGKTVIICRHKKKRFPTSFE